MSQIQVSIAMSVIHFSPLSQHVFFHHCFLYISYGTSKVNISKMKDNLCLVVASLFPKIIIAVQ